MMRTVSLAITAIVLLLGGSAAAFIPPTCDDDPTRTIFAGFGSAPCTEFHGDQASCELSYYLNESGEVTSCAYVAGTCVGCGGRNRACAVNTCSGATHSTAAPACAGDPDRMALLGTGDNGSRRCRNLDQTDQATCENAYYEQDEDDDLGDSVACFWDSPTGACVGCGDNGSPCPFNDCDPALDAPDAECVLDAGRTNLIGYGGNGSNRCRSLDDTDAATCNNSFYEDDDSGLPVACWWDGDECRGSGFDEYFAFNSCLSDLAPPVATATCRLEPGRSNLLGFGHNDTGTCRQLDGTDQTTCEDAFYEAADSGTSIACWWDGDECRGSFDDYALQNACETTVEPFTATCGGRTNLLGLGANDERPCRSLDGTDEATCEEAFYQSARHGLGVACWWDGDDDCRACGGQNEDCTENPCIAAACAGDPTRTNLVGFGNVGDGDEGAACRQLDDTDEATCEDAFYLHNDRGTGVACWWDGDECRGSSRTHRAEDECHVDPVCAQDPGRATFLGFGTGNSPCRSFDESSQAICEDAYYEDDSGRPIACWWAVGDQCLGSANRNELQNECLRDPAAPSAVCTADPGRATLIGYGQTHSGDEGGACRSLDATDEATCEDAFYETIDTHEAIACWWDGGVCRGSANEHAANNACDPPVVCPLDPDRTNYVGDGGDGEQPCRQLDETDQAACEDAFYESVSGAPAAVACWWNGEDCRGSVKRFDNNACFYELPLRTAGALCGGRGNLLGFGDNSSRPCRSLDGTDEATCEDAYYQSDDNGFAIGCWWDGDECRGSSREFAAENECPVDGECTLDPGRSNLLGLGNNGLGNLGGACRQLDGSDESTCENAFYINDGDGGPVACWWEEEAEDCRGSAEDFAVQNACVRAAPTPVTCAGRNTSLGFGNNAGNTCRQLDGTSQAECEDAFYVHDNENRAVACVWESGGDACFGTVNWPALNACDPAQEAPGCGARTLLGKGDRSNAPCRQFDATSEPICEAAYYLNRANDPIACWWDGDECRGSHDRFRSENECAPPVTCGARTNRIGFGGNNSNACPNLNDTDQATCENAFYVASGDDRPVACHWNAADNDCEGCNRLNETNSTCAVNVCDPIECPGDAGRTRVDRCNDIDTESECEDAWHITGDHDFAPIASSCFWNAELGDCLGCGPQSQSARECANTCEDGCGNGVLDNGETCDDGNMYEGDCCDSTCQLEADGEPCTDRLFCTVGPGTCQAGICTGAEPRDCASCLGGDCSESENECVTREGDEGEPAVAAQLQGQAPVDMSFPLPLGTECDDGLPDTASACDGNGMCVEELVVPTMTATSTPTATITATATSTPTITETPVPVGGPCADTAQCVDGAACVEGFCAVVTAPAPVASNRGLLAIVVALLAVAALNMRRRRQDS